MKQPFYEAIIKKQKKSFFHLKKNREWDCYGDIRFIIYHKTIQPGDFVNFSFIHPKRNLIVFVFAQTSFAKLNDDMQNDASETVLKKFNINNDKEELHNKNKKIFKMVSKRRKKIKGYSWNNPLTDYPNEYFNDVKQTQLNDFNSKQLYLSQGIETESTKKGINIFYDILKHKIEHKDIFNIIDTVVKYMDNHNTFITNLIPLSAQNKEFFKEQFLN